MDRISYIHITSHDKETKCKFMRYIAPMLSDEFEKYYLGDPEEVSKRVNTLFLSLYEPILTFLDACMILLFYDGYLDMEDFITFLTMRSENHLLIWLRSHLTSRKDEDATVNIPREKLLKRHPDFYLHNRMKRSLFQKGFVIAIVTAMYRNKYELSPTIYTNSYIHYDAKGVMKGLAMNDGNIELTNQYINWASFPAFCHIVNNILHIKNLFLQIEQKYDKKEKLFENAFRPFSSDERGIEGFFLAFPQLRDEIFEFLQGVNLNAEWKNSFVLKVI